MNGEISPLKRRTLRFTSQEKFRRSEGGTEEVVGKWQLLGGQSWDHYDVRTYALLGFAM